MLDSVAVGARGEVDDPMAHYYHYYRTALAGQTLASVKPIHDTGAPMPRDRIIHSCAFRRLEYVV